MKENGIILFVDHDTYCHEVANLIISYLTKFKIINAQTSTAALSLAQEHSNKIKIIFLDILMPDMRGDQLYEELIKNPNLKNIPIVFQSGIVEKDQNIVRLLQKDNIYVLPKPYDKTQLLEIINRLVDT